jgi:hypothetical protein
VATLVTSTVVLPIKVERKSFDLPLEARPDRAQLVSSKWVAGVAPVLAVAAAIAAGVAFQNGFASLVVFAIAMAGMLAMAFGPVHRSGLSVAYTVIFAAAFAAEVVAGGILLLATAGVGYLVLGGGAAWGLIAVNVRSVRAARAGRDGAPPVPPKSSPPSAPPPLLPRPPSSED